MLDKQESVQTLYKNIQFIKAEHGLSSDSDLCKVTGIAKGTLSAVKSGEKLPMLYPFFYQLCNYSGYTVDELINKDIEAEKGKGKTVDDELKEQEFSAFLAPYTAYYYDTSSVKGSERKDDYEALSYGIVIIYRDENDKNKEYRCCGEFGLTREEQEKRYNSLFTQNAFGRPVLIKNYGTEYINRYFGPNFYTGTFTISENSIVLKLDSSQDSLTMMLNRLKNMPRKYIGGLAAALSVGTGVYQEPVMQLVGLARGLLTMSPAEIGKLLTLNYPRIECRAEDEDELIDMMHSIVDGHLAHDPNGLSVYSLTLDQERAILDFALNRAINNTVQRNLGRTIQVTAYDEERWYSAVKRAEKT